MSKWGQLAAGCAILNLIRNLTAWQTCYGTFSKKAVSLSFMRSLAVLLPLLAAAAAASSGMQILSGVALKTDELGALQLCWSDAVAPVLAASAMHLNGRWPFGLLAVCCCCCCRCCLWVWFLARPAAPQRCIAAAKPRLMQVCCTA